MPISPHSSAFSDNFKIDSSSPSGLRWITKHNGVSSSIAGFKDCNGYWRVKLAGKKHHVAAIVLELAGLPRPSAGHTPDHINRDKGDNSLKNLRWADLSVQSQNRRTWAACGFKFVTQLANGKFRARGQLNGKWWSAGLHDSAYAAHMAALAKRLEVSWL